MWNKIVLFGCMLGFCAGILCAEELDTMKISNLVELDEVVIQSFKQDRRLETAPLAASAVNGATLRHREVTGIKEVSSLIPNLFIPDYGSKLTSPVYIRGIGSRINAPSVGLYIDGVPFFEKSAFDFDFSEIDRIEVLRGPQGTLYGRNTMGGIINVYTRSPRKYQGTNVSFTGGNYTYLKGSASHYGTLSDRVVFAVSADVQNQDGYFKNEYTGEKADDLFSASGRVRLEWEMTDRLTMRVMSSLDHTDQGGYPYAPYDSTKQVADKVNYNDYSSYKRLLSTSGLNMDYRADRFRVGSQTSFQYLSDDQEIDQDFSPADRYFVTQKQKQRMFSEELNVKSNLGTDYQWLFGAFAFYQGIDNTVRMNYKERYYFTHKDYDMPTYGAALYHQSVFNNLLTDGLSLTLGLRFDYEHAENDYVAKKETETDSKETDHFDAKLSFKQLTPKVAIQYTFPAGQMVYGTATKGYKTGGFNTSFSTDADRTFDPEYSWNYEVGAKAALIPGVLSAEFAVFYIDWRKQQISQSIASEQGSMLKNAGKSESKGVELSLHGSPFNGFLWQLQYGYTHAKFKEYQRSATIDYGGKFLPMVPRNTFSLSADYTLSSVCKAIDRMTFSLAYTGTGKLYWTEANEASQSRYGLLNGKISVTKGIATLSVWAKNITNTDYTAFYFEAMGSRFAQKGKPFTFGGSIAMSF
ncbi:MAG: TonB-dependent receptor [Massilibacteroides sp.]|nr:TonB-dependent receptor [Massilibacteroides sp.]MDD3063065.1 TonB-dependent receptor [Massilibacteroides sp.]MDD4114283.1 TonB-dependent receptor [Massilibacteroides sp.]MDD4660380.1 TonB-dependent receptor [Massilibacteroides sp.]